MAQEAGVRPDWPVPTSRSVVASRGLDLSVCGWGDVASARLVLIGAHGFLDCAEFFAPLAAAVRARRPDAAFLAMSFAGHGGSSWADSYGWYDHTADLIAVVRAVAARAAAREQLALVGHSFGAVQVLQAMSLQPALADVVVNLDAVSPPSSYEGGGLPGALAAFAERGGDIRPLPIYARLDEMVERRAAANPRIGLDLLRWLAPFLVREERGRYAWRVDPALAGWVRPWDLAGSPPVDPLQLAAELPHAVLVVTGAADDHPQVRGRYPGDAAVGSVPRACHVRVAEAGHYVHVECPDRVAEVIVRHAERQREMSRA